MSKKSYPWATDGAEIDHVGFLTEDFESVIELFGERLGMEVGHREDNAALGLSFLWVRCGGVPLEFIAPTDPGSGAAARLRERGPGVDHIALRVDSVDESLRWCREREVPLIDEVPRPGANGSLIAFLAPEGTGGARVELVEPAAAGTADE
jgi:methylmalonyl-CoA/ethylmalonyl-CoA epimerase